MSLKHLHLFEEIGFSYAGKGEDSSDPFEKDDTISPFSLSSIERSYKKISKSAFEAGQKNTMNFEDWWNKTWNFGNPIEKKSVAKNPIGFVRPTAETPVSLVEDKPRRIGPKITPGRPGRPGRPSPNTKPKRRSGIWFEEE